MELTYSLQKLLLDISIKIASNRSADIEAFECNDERAFLIVKSLGHVIREQGLQEK